MEKKKRKKKKSMSNEDYKKLCVQKHGNTYILDDIEYVSMKEDVYPTCRKHGQFKICAYDFAHLRGCPHCGRENRKKTQFKRKRRNMSFDEFKAIAEPLHNYKYEYVRDSFVNLKERMKMICPIHGEFKQPPSSHLNGHGCEKCGIIQRSLTQTITTEDYINKCTKIHNGYYDYTPTKYKGCYNDVEVICPKHGLFSISAYSHLQGHGCKKCGIEKLSTKLVKPLSVFINDAKNAHPYDENDYSKVKYIGAKIPIEIICPNGHRYFQTPNKHLCGHGCKYCAKIVSSYEMELHEFLKSFDISFESSNRKILNNSKELDIYLPSYKIAIEFNGLYWHSSDKRGKLIHLEKTNECEQKGVRLMHIFEDEWLNKNCVVKSQIKRALDKLSETIDINQCRIKELNKEEVKLFITENDLVEYTKSSINFGVLYGNAIVSILSLLKIGNNKYKITHNCDRVNTKINNSFATLLNYFIQKYKPSEILIDIDRHVGIDDRQYTECGFEKCEILPPTCYYVNKQNRLLKNSTNKPMPTIYDCGYIHYKLKINGKDKTTHSPKR